MKKVLVLTLIMVLALSAFAWAGTTKPTDVNSSQTVDSVTNVNANGNTTHVQGTGVVDGTINGMWINSAELSYFAGTTIRDRMIAWLNSYGTNKGADILAYKTALENAPAGSAVYLNASNLAGAYIAADGSVKFVSYTEPASELSDYSNSCVAGRGSFYYNLPGQTYMSVAGMADKYTNTTYSDAVQSGTRDGGTTTDGTEQKSYLSGGFLTVKYTQINKTHTTLIDYTVTDTAHYSAYKSFGAAYCSPVILDLDGDGKLQASNGKWYPHSTFEGAKSMFDITADGFEKIVEWVGPNDGILIVPTDSKEITANDFAGTIGGYLDGYQKLSLYDTNKDNVLSNKELQGFKVWTDKNGNGTVDKGEVKTVEELKISEIAVSNQNLTSSFVQDGARKYSWDWFPTYVSLEKVAVQK